MDFVEGILRLSDLFNGLSDDQFKTLVGFCREEVYEAGIILFREGDLCDTIYIVASGSLALEMKLQIGLNEGSVTIGVVSRGGCVGHSGLKSPYRHTMTGRTLERTEVITLDSRILRRWCEENPEAGFRVMTNVAKVIASRLEHSRKTLGHILSIVFHDLKAPLASVESVNRLILSGIWGELGEKQKEMLQRSSKGISAMLDLLNNIMNVSRLGVRDVVMGRISLAPLIMSTVDEMRPLADDRGLEIKVEMAQELTSIRGDQTQLKHVIMNLLSNAIKFTPAGGSVTVRVKDEAEYLQVEVIDTGIGIATEEVPKIFDEFYRGLDLTERGAGLGLSIAKRIVEAHGGKILAVSPAPGSAKGSQFIVTLPKDVSCAGEEALVGKG
jgi:signal transduction histidine kinase